MNSKKIVNNQKININTLRFEDYCLLTNPEYLQCKKTEKAFYDVQELLISRKLSELVGCRYSWYFIERLIELNKKREFISEIINEIECLENFTVYKTNTKTQTPFDHEPLKGLWHKHFHLGNFKNMKIMYLDPLIKNKKWSHITQECRDLEKKRKKGDTNLSLVCRVLKKHTIDDYESRIEKAQLTGEWIIYHEFLGENYYLGLWEHDELDEDIAVKIKSIFKSEFKEFKDSLPIFSD